MSQTVQFKNSDFPLFLRILLPLALVPIFSAGCLSFTTERVSRPVPIPAVANVNKRNVLTFSPPEADVSVSVRNSYTERRLYLITIVPIIENTPWTAAVRRPPLLISVAVKQKCTDLIFDPARVFYCCTNQMQLAPRSADAYEILKQFGFSKVEHPLWENALKPVSLKEYSYNFKIHYDVDWSPNLAFDILLDGLSKGGQPIPLPPIHFEPGTSHDSAFYPSSY